MQFPCGEFQNEIGRALVAQHRGAHAEVVGRSHAPCPRTVIIVIRSAAGVHALHQSLRLGGSAALPRADAAATVFVVGRDEDVDAARILAQDVVGATAHENRRLPGGDLADHVALDLEQRVVELEKEHAAAEEQHKTLFRRVENLEKEQKTMQAFAVSLEKIESYSAIR